MAYNILVIVGFLIVLFAVKHSKQKTSYTPIPRNSPVKVRVINLKNGQVIRDLNFRNITSARRYLKNSIR